MHSRTSRKKDFGDSPAILKDHEGYIQVPASLVSSAVIREDRIKAAGFCPPKEGEFSSRFFAGLRIERSLTEQENALLEIVENAAKRHGFDVLLSYLSGIPEEYLRRLAKLKSEAKSKGISNRTFYDFFELMMYSKKITTVPPQHKGCITDIIIAGSSIALLVQELFNGSEVLARDGVRLNGIFGKQGIVRSHDDIHKLNDLMPFMYITATSLNHKFPLPTYYLFFGETPNPVTIPMRDSRLTAELALASSNSKEETVGRIFLEQNSGPWFNADLILARTRKFMKEASEMCLEVVQDPPGVIIIDGGVPKFLPVLTVIYDLEGMTMWRVERSHGHIYAQKLEEYLEEHLDHDVYPKVPMFERKDVVLKHIDRLRSHSSHGDEHLQLRQSSFKKVGCVDGRVHNNCSELGALLSEREFENVLTDNHTARVDMVFHTECGYVYTAITLHKIFHALRIGIDPEDKVTLGRATSFINTLMRSPWVNKDKDSFFELLSHVDLTKVSTDPKVQKQVYDDLFSFFTDNSGTLRYATSHMMDRQLFEIESGFPVMTATVNVETALRRWGINIEPEDAKVLVVEEIARMDRAIKTKWLKQNESHIERSRIDEKIPAIEWKMEDLVTGRSYFIPPKFALEQTKAELLNLKRQDVITLVEFDITRPDPVIPDHLVAENEDNGGDAIDLFLRPIGDDKIEVQSSGSISPPPESSIIELTPRNDS